MTDSFEGRHALIIGGGANIGRAIAHEFARRGARISVADRNEAGARETAASVIDAGGQAAAEACDVTDEASIARTIDAAVRAFGPIDILVNNAGILSGGNPEDIPLSGWQHMMDVNFFGMVRSIEAILPEMLARSEGHIVNTASFAGLYPFASSRIHYAAAKAAVVSMSENLALYLLPLGVRVSCLCPGPVMTTSDQTMHHFSAEYAMRAPGSHLTVKSQEETARILADGMEAKRIIIPTHEELWATLAERAASPDAFILGKAAEFAAGNSGRPQVPEEFRRARTA